MQETRQVLGCPVGLDFSSHFGGQKTCAKKIISQQWLSCVGLACIKCLQQYLATVKEESKTQEQQLLQPPMLLAVKNPSKYLWGVGRGSSVIVCELFFRRPSSRIMPLPTRSSLNWDASLTHLQASRFEHQRVWSNWTRARLCDRSRLPNSWPAGNDTWYMSWKGQTMHDEYPRNVQAWFLNCPARTGRTGDLEVWRRRSIVYSQGRTRWLVNPQQHQGALRFSPHRVHLYPCEETL